MDALYESLIEVQLAPWKIDSIITTLLAIEDETEAKLSAKYVSSLLRFIPIRPNHPLSLGELFDWCWGGRGIDNNALPGLAWAVVMRPIEAPNGGISYSVFWDERDWPHSTDAEDYRYGWIRRQSRTRKARVGEGFHAGHVYETSSSSILEKGSHEDYYLRSIGSSRR